MRWDMMLSKPNPEAAMASTPTEPRPLSHHGHRSWTSFWYDDAGKRRCKRFGRCDEVSERAARNRYAAWMATWKMTDHVRNPDSAPANYTARRLATDYFAHAEQHYVKNGQPTSSLWEVKYAMEAVADAWGNRPLVRVQSHELAQLRDRMIWREDGSPRSVRTVNGRLAIIKQAARWAASERGFIPDAVAVAMSMVKPLVEGRCEARSTDAIRPVDEDVVARTIEAAPAVLGDMIRLMWYTGMRPGEVAIMRACDVEREGEVWIYRPSTHKTEHLAKSRVVALGPQAQRILSRYLDAIKSPAAYLFSPRSAQAQRRHGIPRGTSNVYTDESFRRALHYACDRAWPHPELEAVLARHGYKAGARWRREHRDELRDWRRSHHWNPNQLRHAWATRVRARFGVEAASTGLGHASIDTTLIYAERSLERAREVAAAVG